MKEYTEDYLKQINELIDNKDEAQVLEQIKDMHPADIAELVSDLDANEALFIMQLLDEETAADVLAALLADAGCDTFEPSDTGLTAYILQDAYDEIKNALEDQRKELRRQVRVIDLFCNNKFVLSLCTRCVRELNSTVFRNLCHCKKCLIRECHILMNTMVFLYLSFKRVFP